jgi:hypothetical protein
VRILNRKDCCGFRLAGTMVYVDNQVCQSVPGYTNNGQWYTVKCKQPLFGRKVRLVTTQNTYLSISGFEAFTGVQSTTSKPSADDKRPNTKIELIAGTAK